MNNAFYGFPEINKNKFLQNGFPFTGSAGISGSLLVDGNIGIGTNGFRMQILTASGSLTAGYQANTGSIGNGHGVLYIKTGSANEDWAPITYEKGPMPERTYTGIDMSLGDYTIPGPGIYEITVGSNTYSLIFPDPSNFSGQKITVINTDTSNAAYISNTNTFAPYDKGDSVQLTSTDYKAIINSLSIGGKWRNLR